MEVAAQTAEPPAAASAEPDPAPPPNVQVAAIEPPAPAAGQPLMLVRSQDASNLLGRGAGDRRSGSGLNGIQSGNPQRMVSGITGPGVR
jgi:hypothetical protein